MEFELIFWYDGDKLNFYKNFITGTSGSDIHVDNTEMTVRGVNLNMNFH